MPVNRTLRAIQKKVGAGWYRFTNSCIDGMEASGINPGDILDVILDAADSTVQSGLTGEKARQNGRVAIRGKILEHSVRVVVDAVSDPEVVVISAHWIEEG